MLVLSLTLCGWQAKFKLPYPQQPFVDHNLVMKEMQSQQFVRKIHFLGVVTLQSKPKPTMAYRSMGWLLPYSMAGLFISAIAVLPQAVSFTHVNQCHFFTGRTSDVQDL